jgi:hypothetical protein
MSNVFLKGGTDDKQKTETGKRTFCMEKTRPSCSAGLALLKGGGIEPWKAVKSLFGRRQTNRK